MLFFPLERVVLMLSKNRGFTLIEVLVAFSLVMLLVTTFIPISSIIQQHTTILSDRRIISSKLHDELLKQLWEEKSLMSESFTENVNKKKVEFYFTIENELIKGCATWDNAKNKNEKFCLYGSR